MKLLVLNKFLLVNRVEIIPVRIRLVCFSPRLFEGLRKSFVDLCHFLQDETLLAIKFSF